MTRNLDKRVELMFPVDDQALKARVIVALRAMFRDNVKARRLTGDGSYTRRRPPKGEAAFRVQQFLQEESHRLAAIARDRVGISFRAQQSEAPDLS
jgi:polyphosphate kinase